jgi:hypothetical protein
VHGSVAGWAADGCAALVSVCRVPTVFLDLVEEVGGANAPWSAGFDAGFDRGADVVGVHVAIPHAVPADDDDGVAERRPGVLEGGNRRVLRFEEVHDLVPKR